MEGPVVVLKFTPLNARSISLGMLGRVTNTTTLANFDEMLAKKLGPNSSV